MKGDKFPDNQKSLYDFWRTRADTQIPLQLHTGRTLLREPQPLTVQLLSRMQAPLIYGFLFNPKRCGIRDPADRCRLQDPALTPVPQTDNFWPAPPHPPVSFLWPVQPLWRC